MKPLEIEPNKRWGNFTFMNILERGYDEKGNLKTVIRVRCDCGSICKQSLHSLRYYYKPMICGNAQCFESRRMIHLNNDVIERPSMFNGIYHNTKSTLEAEIGEMEREIIKKKYVDYTDFEKDMEIMMHKTKVFCNGLL